jgi:hypothetical protein
LFAAAVKIFPPLRSALFLEQLFYFVKRFWGISTKFHPGINPHNANQKAGFAGFLIAF